MPYLGRFSRISCRYLVLAALACVLGVPVAHAQNKSISPLESRRFVQMDELNALYLMPIAMRLGGKGEAMSNDMRQLYRAQMGFIAAQMTRDPTVPVPDYADCLQKFDGTEQSVPVICKLTIDKVMSKFGMAKVADNASEQNFMIFLRVYTLSQRNIMAVGRYLKQPFTPDEIASIATYHAFRLTQEKDAVWLNTFRTCVESNSQTITCKKLELEKTAADLTLDYLKAVNGDMNHGA